MYSKQQVKCLSKQQQQRPSSVLCYVDLSGGGGGDFARVAGVVLMRMSIAHVAYMQRGCVACLCVRCKEVPTAVLC